MDSTDSSIDDKNITQKFCRARYFRSTHCLNFIPRGGLVLQDFPGLLKSPLSKWRIVREKTRTKAFFFEEILLNTPLENLPELNKERMQNFCHALKLNL